MFNILIKAFEVFFSFSSDSGYSSLPELLPLRPSDVNFFCGTVRLFLSTSSRTPLPSPKSCHPWDGVQGPTWEMSSTSTGEIARSRGALGSSTGHRGAPTRSPVAMFKCKSQCLLSCRFTSWISDLGVMPTPRPQPPCTDLPGWWGRSGSRHTERRSLQIPPDACWGCVIPHEMPTARAGAQQASSHPHPRAGPSVQLLVLSIMEPWEALPDTSLHRRSWLDLARDLQGAWFTRAHAHGFPHAARYDHARW